MTKSYIGTSGWQYPDFQARFYPDDLDKSEELGFYAKKFPSVEVNNTFYQLPNIETIKHWVKQTPQDFVFSVKASRYITHMKNLLEPQKTLPKFFDRIAHFEDKCGPILFQLPPNWQVDADRLKGFLDALPDDHRYTFEFRNKTWFTDEIYDLLRSNNISFCIYDFNGRQSPRITTTNLVYIRLHGPGQAYRDPYEKGTLQDWAGRIKSWLKDEKEVYCYFDNTYQGHAWDNAQTLFSIL